VSDEPGVQGPLGAIGPTGPRGPDGWQMPKEQADAMMIKVHEALMRDFVYRKPWWKRFWRHLSNGED
jgi:hypothetical protein